MLKRRFSLPTFIFSLALLLIAGLELVQAQPGRRWRQESHRNTNAIIKLGVHASPIPRPMVGAGVEFKVGDASTLQADLQFGLPMKLREQNVSLFHGGAQYRYYFRGYEPFTGLYAGFVLGYNTMSFSNADLATNASFFSFPTGLNFGYQIAATQHVSVDLTTSMGFSPGTLLIGRGTREDFAVRDYDNLFFKAGVAVGFGW